MNKLERLAGLLGGLENALIAYSGGVDSVFLAKVAFDRMGKRVKAVTAISPSYPTYELDETRRIAKEIGIEHEILKTEELGRPEYRANRGDRCYFCKTELYETMAAKAKEWGYRWLLNGVNVDDLGDYRPGLKAADENGVRSPLVEAGLTKAEIRELSKSLGLSTWDKPALACLSSRFPPGTEVTEERLGRIDRIESALVGMGFRTVRVRFHEPIARIEVGAEEFERFLKPETRERVDRLCRENGFLYSALDLAGYKMGSVNQVLLSSPQLIKPITGL
jgi:uncharacterized protein